MSQEDKIRFSDLRKLMGDVFGLEDLHDLFMDLHMDPENADGKGKEAVIRYLVGECHKQKRFLELLEICARERPTENWAQFEQLATVENDDLLAHPHLPVYKKWVVQQYNVMRLLSMERQVSLDAIYTDVYLIDEFQYGQSFSGIAASVRLDEFTNRQTTIFQERFSGVEILQKKKRLFIMGQPGVGKTTFLKWLAIQSSLDKFDFNKIPIFVEMRQLNDEAKTLEQLLSKPFLLSGLPEVKTIGYVEKLIKYSKALILLDGLDEVKSEHRQRVNDQIMDLDQKSGSDCLIVISCRSLAEKRKFPTFAYLRMAEFTPEQVNHFVKNWFGNEEVKAKSLIKKLEETEHKPIQELTRIPLFLILLCITYSREGVFPENRVDIYRRALEIILRKWDDERGIQRNSVYGQLSITRKEELLAFVAFRTFVEDQLFISQKELEGLIKEYWQIWREEEISYQKEKYGQVYPPELPVRDINTSQVITEIITQHGIFVEQFEDVYSFAHLSFHEYYVSRFIVENLSQGTLEQLLEHLIDSQWREIFLLAVSLLDDTDVFLSNLVISLNNFVSESTLLSRLLTWTKIKVNRVSYEDKISYGIVSLQVWFLEFAREIARALSLDRAKDLGDELNIDNPICLALVRILEIERTLKKPFPLKFTEALDCAFDRALQLNEALNYARYLDSTSELMSFVDFNVEGVNEVRILDEDKVQEQFYEPVNNDQTESVNRGVRRIQVLSDVELRALKLDPALAQIHALSFDRKLGINEARVLDIRLVINLSRVHAQDLDLESFSMVLSNLLIPELGDSKENWEAFVRSLTMIIKQLHEMLDLPYLQEVSKVDIEAIQDMDWSEKGLDQYVSYLYATRLVADCLSLLLINDRIAIENYLFLPSE